jgi:hypothetical protein
MPSFTLPRSPDGLLVDIETGLAAADVLAFRQAGRPIPQPVQARALLDIGSGETCLDSGLLAPVRAAGLTPARVVLVNVAAAGGTALAPVYMLTITVPHPQLGPKSGLTRRAQAVIDLNLRQFGYDALIGRDILEACLLFHDGPGGTFTLAY